jgi:hypothetical protein
MQSLNINQGVVSLQVCLPQLVHGNIPATEPLMDDTFGWCFRVEFVPARNDVSTLN